MKKIETQIKYNLSQEECEEIKQFLSDNTHSNVDQDIEWHRINNPKHKVCYFYHKVNNEIRSYSIIRENRFFSHIHMGPIGKSGEDIIEAIRYLRKHYRSKGQIYFSVQLPMQTSQLSDQVEYQLKLNPGFKQYFDASTWSSVGIDLTPNEDEILRNFKKNHKGSVKKAIKQNLTSKIITSQEEIKSLSVIYNKLYEHRGLTKNFSDTNQVFQGVFYFFEKYNAGFFLGIYLEEKLIGGVINAIRGNTLHYKYGASEPDFKKYPVLHLALYQSCLEGKKRGLEFFDLGGFNHFVGEKHQVYHINFFKKQFNGPLLYYPKVLYFPLKKGLYLLLKLAIKIKNR